MEPWASVLVSLLLCGVLSALSLRFGLMTRSGAAASFAVGLLIALLGSLSWLLLLIAFSVLGFIVTRFRITLKEKLGVQEGRKGERTWRNVAANGLVPAAVAAISFVTGNQGSEMAALAYISSVAVAASDTTASELGVLSRKAYLITTFKEVPPGTDGGVSVYGTVWCAIASLIASALGFLLILQSPFDPLILVAAVLGIAGCMADSVIGATLERSGRISKLGTNMSSMALGALLAALIYVALNPL